MQEISSASWASAICWAFRPVFRSQNVMADPSQPVITCPMLGLYTAAHKGLQWVVLLDLLALIATILISARQSLLAINKELMGDFTRRNGKGPCSGILCPNGNLIGIVWRQTCSLTSQDFKTCDSRQQLVQAKIFTEVLKWENAKYEFVSHNHGLFKIRFYNIFHFPTITALLQILALPPDNITFFWNLHRIAKRVAFSHLNTVREHKYIRHFFCFLPHLCHNWRPAPVPRE